MSQEPSAGQYASGSDIAQSHSGSSSNVIRINTVPPGPFKPLHQLRAPVGDFIGRETEIDTLVQSLTRAREAQRPALGIIWGMGGVGKTQLACTLAQRIRDEFGDAQLFLELQGVDAHPLSVEHALQQVILAFEPQAQLPEGLAGLQALYRSILDGRRVLIVADNAYSADQVSPLQPPPGCALLITSRNHFRLPGAAICDLHTLPAAEAEQLVLSICERVRAAAPRLAALCGRLPLALRVSASLLANDGTRNIQRYLDALEKERLRHLKDPDMPNDPEASVEASLNLSYAALNDAEQRVLQQLSVFSIGFDLAAAVGVISLEGVKPGAGDARALQAAREQAGQVVQPNSSQARPRGRAVPPKVEEVIGKLHRRSLVEHDGQTERYSLHDLIRAFATERLELADISLRYARHYLRVAQQADELYQKGNEHILEGMALFDQERAHIDAAWLWARSQPPSPATDELVLDYAEATSNTGDLRYHMSKERIPQYEAVLVVAQRLKRKRPEMVTLNRLGNAHKNIGDTRRAVEFYERAISLAQDLDARSGEGMFLNNLGYAYQGLGDARRAMTFHEQALAIARELRDRDDESAALNNLGMAYADLGQARQAIAFHEQALTIARELGDRRDEASDLGNLGLAYANLGPVRQAIALHEQSLAIARELGDRRAEGASLGNLGRAYLDLGETEQAIALCEQSLQILQEIGYRRYEAYASNYLALACAAAGQLSRAETLQEQALTLSRTVEDPRIETQILIDIGKSKYQQDDTEGAIEHFTQALALAQTAGLQIETARANWNLGLAHEQQGDLAGALPLLQARVNYERDIGHAKADEHAAYVAKVEAQLNSGESG